MSIIADLIRAGVDPELVQRVHEAIISGGYPPSAALATGQSAREVKASLGPPVGESPDHTREATQASLRSAQNKRAYQRRKVLKTAERAAETAESVAQKGSDGSPHDNTLTPSLPPKTKPTLRSGLERARARTRIDANGVSFDLEFARREGLTEREAWREFEQFADHHRKHGSLMADWQAAWRTWVRNAIKFQARAGPAGRSNGTQGFLEAVAQDIENDRRRREAGTSQTVLSLPEFRQRNGAES